MPATPKLQAVYTPSNNRHVESIQKRALAFNSDLEKLQKKFSDMRDIDYDKRKIDFQYEMAIQSCADQTLQMMVMINHRLKLLQKMHEEGNGQQLSAQIKKIRVGASMVIPKMLDDETKVILTTK